jgi:hypothetical protein
MAYPSNVDCEPASPIGRIRHLFFKVHTPDMSLTLPCRTLTLIFLSASPSSLRSVSARRPDVFSGSPEGRTCRFCTPLFLMSPPAPFAEPAAYLKKFGTALVMTGTYPLRTPKIFPRLKKRREGFGVWRISLPPDLRAVSGEYPFSHRNSRGRKCGVFPGGKWKPFWT